MRIIEDVTEFRCPDQETIAAYIDGSLGGDELVGVSNHLTHCDRCYDTVAATVRFLSGRAYTENVNPPWALGPAIVTAVVMAVALTVCLLLLGHSP